MRKQWMKYLLPILMVGALVAPAAPAAAQRSQDIGQQMEQEYGVLGSNSREGRMWNSMLDNVVDRVVGAVNSQKDQGDFRLRSAKILGGRSEKHDRVMNAFALPDGRIYVTLGLLRALQDSQKPEDELAFVVAHEVTHVAERHSQNQQQKAIGAGLLGAVLGAVTKSRAVDQVIGLGANAYVSHYSREDEYRADKGGLKAMHRAGYDTRYAATMLKRLESKGESQNGFINGLFGSHPLTQNRVNRVKEMSSNLEAGRNIDGKERRNRRR
ncbi:MAG: M48 family metallopeptidase [Armatimonadota bacterium]